MQVIRHFAICGTNHAACLTSAWVTPLRGVIIWYSAWRGDYLVLRLAAAS
ncbi:hypothetical protein [Paenibacillus sp. FSL H7-0756]